MCFFLLIGLILIFSCQQAEETLVEKPMDIHDRVLTVDTHVDTPYMLLQPGFDITKVNDRNEGGGQVDFPRMKQGGLDAMLKALAENGGVLRLQTRLHRRTGPENLGRQFDAYHARSTTIC